MGNGEQISFGKRRIQFGDDFISKHDLKFSKDKRMTAVIIYVNVDLYHTLQRRFSMIKKSTCCKFVQIMLNALRINNISTFLTKH